MTDTPDLLLLIDGHALAFRAFHALSDSGLRASSGEPTYAVYGFASILLAAIQEQRPKYLAVAFDLGRTFRDDMYAEYKAGRGETPSEFHPQLKRIKQFVESLNIPIFTAEGYEADDVIGTLARQATAHHTNTLILTGDTDTLQLVDAHVRVLLANPYGKKTTTTVYDETAVRERYKGLAPTQLADLRGLKGDASDNIPGVKGIGEAGAISLLNEFATVEGLYEQLDRAPKRYQKHLEGQQDQALFSKKLATIVCDVPVTLDLKRAKLDEYDRATVISMFHELEMGTNLIAKLPAIGGGIDVVSLPKQQPPPAEPSAASSADESTVALNTPPVAASAAGPQQLSMFGAPANDTSHAAPLLAPPPVQIDVPPALGEYRAATTNDDLNALLLELTSAPAFAFDTELNGLRPLQDALVGISVSTRPGTAWYIPFGHIEGEQLPREQILSALRPFFADPQRPKYGHNAKFDIEALNTAGVEVNGVVFDTMLAAGLLNKRKGLKDLAFFELKLSDPMTDIQELIGKGKNQITFGQVPVAAAINYAAADADMTLRLVEPLRKALAEFHYVNEIFTDIEMNLMPVLVRMESAGIGVDVTMMQALGKRFGDRLAQLEQDIYAYNQGPFNIGSGPQLSDVLFGKLGIPTSGLDKTKTGAFSLTAAVLENLRDQHPIIELILQHRQLTKLKSTYVDALPELVNPNTHRVHTSYNQLGAATGRLSSTDPNLQNIPTRTDEGREIRRGFIADPGHVFVAADYSQIELRVLAHVTQDENLVSTFKEGRDIHAATASQLFNVPMNEVSKNQRRVAKCVAAGTLVSTERGIIPIEQLGSAHPYEVTELDCIVAQEGQRREQATGFFNGDVQPTIRITTARGYVLEATAQHRVRTLDVEGSYVWRTLGELAQGDYVALARGAMLFGEDHPFNNTYKRRYDKKYVLPTQMSPLFARFLGYFVSEGNVVYNSTSSTIVISNIDAEVLADLRRISVAVFGTVPKELVDKNGVTRMSWHSSRLVELLEYLGTGFGAAHKSIPDAIMQGSCESVVEFLRAYYEGDGSVSKSFISAGSKSYGLIQRLQTLLLNFGIVSRIEPRDIPEHGRHYKLLVIGRDGRKLFAHHIGFVTERKNQRLRELVVRRETNEPILLPLQRERLVRMYPNTKRDLKETIHMCIRTKSPTVGLTYRRLSTIVEQFPDHEDPDIQVLKAHQERNLFFDRVAVIEHDEKQVYDLVVPETHTYIANGFVSHNTVVFGVIYGISSFGLAPRIGASRSEAQTLIDQLFTRFPGIRDYIDQTLEFGRREGYVQSLFGRRRYVPELQQRGPRRQAAEREAVNAPIQATAADIMKIAMIRVDAELRQQKLAARLLLQVHDELILEAPHAEADTVAQLVCAQMAGAYELSVPLQVDVEQGQNWLEMQDIKT